MSDPKREVEFFNASEHQRAMAEGMLYVPAGCCCDESKWLGKKLERAPEVHGSFHRMPAAVPPMPIDGWDRPAPISAWRRVVTGVTVAAALAITAAWAVIHFTTV